MIKLDEIIEYIEKYQSTPNYKNDRLNERYKLEDEIINLINKNENILTQQDSEGRNLGMICVEKELSRVVLRCLESYKASTQQDIDGWNIGMYAVYYLNCNYFFKKIITKIKKNKTAVNQRDKDDKTVKDYFKEIKKGKIVFLSQYNHYISLERIKKFYKSKNYYSLHQAENEIIKIIKKNKNILKVQDSQGLNLGMICAKNKFEGAVLLCLDSREASIQQDKNGMNIGMYAADKKLITATNKALDNHEASIQQDKNGMNIGMHAAKYINSEIITKKVLENEEATKQISNEGKNIIEYYKEEERRIEEEEIKRKERAEEIRKEIEEQRRKKEEEERKKEEEIRKRRRWIEEIVRRKKEEKRERYKETHWADKNSEYFISGYTGCVHYDGHDWVDDDGSVWYEDGYGNFSRNNPFYWDEFEREKMSKKLDEAYKKLKKIRKHGTQKEIQKAEEEYDDLRYEYYLEFESDFGEEEAEEM